MLSNLFSLRDEKADLDPVLLHKKNMLVVPTLAKRNKVENAHRSTFFYPKIALCCSQDN
jgi:hypothetical protein